MAGVLCDIVKINLEVCCCVEPIVVTSVVAVHCKMFTPEPLFFKYMDFRR